MLFLALCDLIYMRTFLFYYTESVKKCQCCLGVFFFFFLTSENLSLLNCAGEDMDWGQWLHREGICVG